MNFKSTHYYLTYAFAWLLALLPISLLYVISSSIYPVIYHVVRYRRRVVRKNLTLAFPQKNRKEILSIERSFYKFFCDTFVEIIHEIHVSPKQLKKRFTYENYELILNAYAEGKSVMVMTAHYANWEWTLGFPLILQQPSNPIYKKIADQKIDKLMQAIRSRFGAKLIEKDNLLRQMYALKAKNEMANFWMISDQRPKRNHVDFWMTFLNQDTAPIVGAEQLAKKFDYPVCYAEITRVKRGYYHCKFIPICYHPKETKKYEITKVYMNLLEETIKRAPAYWLWTHNRWKNAKPASEKLITD